MFQKVSIINTLCYFELSIQQKVLIFIYFFHKNIKHIRMVSEGSWDAQDWKFSFASQE